MSGGEGFRLSVKIPTGPSELRLRVGLALVETAIDRVLAQNARLFEQSLVDSEAPLEDLADLLQWQHEQALEARARILAEVREWLTRECQGSEAHTHDT